MSPKNKEEKVLSKRNSSSKWYIIRSVQDTIWNSQQTQTLDILVSR